ncbi:MAG: DUF6000 family protein [Cyanobacteria bacterium P01_F01_bin.150]
MSLTIQERYINPIYLGVLNSNFLGLKHQKLSKFIADTTSVLESVRDKELIYMYQGGDWRWSMVASWICGIGCFTQYIDRIGTLLCDHNGYADQFHCFALARFGNEEAIAILNNYLSQRQADTHPANNYWTSWRYFHGFGALKWLDKQHGTDYSSPYRVDLEKRVKAHYAENPLMSSPPPYAPNFEDASAQLQRVIDFVDKHFSLN